MSTEAMMYFWLGISIVLALGHMVNSFQWYKVIIKIVALKTRINELEAELKLYKSPR